MGTLSPVFAVLLPGILGFLFLTAIPQLRLQRVITSEDLALSTETEAFANEAQALLSAVDTKVLFHCSSEGHDWPFVLWF